MPCNICLQSCRKNQQAMICVLCKSHYHRKCTPVTRSQFKDSFTGVKEKSFVCETCNEKIRMATEQFACQINNDDDGSPELGSPPGVCVLSPLLFIIVLVPCQSNYVLVAHGSFSTLTIL